MILRIVIPWTYKTYNFMQQICSNRCKTYNTYKTYKDLQDLQDLSPSTYVEPNASGLQYTQ